MKRRPPTGDSIGKGRNPERRRQLLDAAMAAFGKSGYHRTQVSDIIGKAGVARGTFYLYFKGKREIFGCVMTELFERVRAEVRSIPMDAVSEIPNQLWGNIERAVNLFFDHPLLSRILFGESVGLDRDLDERLRKFYGQLLDLIRRGLRQGRAMGFVRDGNDQILSIGLLGCIKEVLYQELLGTEKQDRKAFVREIFSLVIHAVAIPNRASQLKEVIG